MNPLEPLLLARIAELMDAQPGTDDATELLLLTSLQEFYERDVMSERTTRTLQCDRCGCPLDRCVCQENAS